LFALDLGGSLEIERQNKLTVALLSLLEKHVEETAVLLVVQLVVVDFAHLDVEEGAHGSKTHLTDEVDLLALADQLIHKQDLVEQIACVLAKTADDSS